MHFSIPLILLSTSVCYGACDPATRVAKLENEMDEVRMQTLFCNYGAKLASGYPSICSSNWTGSASLLIWQAYEGKTENALVDETTAFTLNEHPAHTARVNFDWQVGYRIGIGYNFFYDTSACSDWDLEFTYTYYHAAKSENASFDNGSPVPGGVIALEFPPFIAGQITYGDSISKRRITFSTFDLDLGRSFFVTRNISFRPFAGLKGALIFQRLHVLYLHAIQDPLDEQIAHNDFRGVGIKGGIDTNFYFNSQWSLFDTFAGALLFGKFHDKAALSSLDVTVSNLPIAVLTLKTSENRVVPQIQNILGLSWETNVRNDHSHLSLSVGYEFQYWWSQNQLYHFINGVDYLYTRHNDDLAVHGFSLDLKYDF